MTAEGMTGHKRAKTCHQVSEGTHWRSCRSEGISIQKVARVKKSLESTRLRKIEHPLGTEKRDCRMGKAALWEWGTNRKESLKRA